jgi:hypothetical protein
MMYSVIIARGESEQHIIIIRVAWVSKPNETKTDG